MSLENKFGPTGSRPPENNSPEAADILNRAQSGNEDALKEFLSLGDDPVWVDDMPKALGLGDSENSSNG